MTTQRTFALLLGIACTCLFTQNASAQYCGNGHGYYDLVRLYRHLETQVPHFAAHPPVYYSYPVARPYGYSPFAYLPHVQTPEIVEAVAPQEIINSFYVPNATKVEKPSEDTTTQRDKQVEPLLVINPYVAQPKTELKGPILQASLVK